MYLDHADPAVSDRSAEGYIDTHVSNHTKTSVPPPSERSSIQTRSEVSIAVDPSTSYITKISKTGGTGRRAGLKPQGLPIICEDTGQLAVPRQLFAFAHSAYNPYAIHKRYANLPMVHVFNNPQRRQLPYSGYQSVCTVFFLHWGFSINCTSSFFSVCCCLR
jgi:hypothetical protein